MITAHVYESNSVKEADDIDAICSIGALMETLALRHPEIGIIHLPGKRVRVIFSGHDFLFQVDRG